MSTDIVPRETVDMTTTSWRPTGPLSYEEWVAQGERLGVMGRASMWWIGDWVNYGEAAYGEKYTQALDATGLEYGTLRNCAYVAARIDMSRRRDNPPWSHHQELAALEFDAQEQWLDRAASENLSREKLRTALRSGRAATDPAPDDPLAPTHRASITFLLAAESDDAAHTTVKALADLLSKRGAQVTHKHAERIGR